MKKFIYLFLVTVFAITTFTSCSKDDDDKDFSLNGTSWTCATIVDDVDVNFTLKFDNTSAYFSAIATESGISVSIDIDELGGDYSYTHNHPKITITPSDTEEFVSFSGAFSDSKTLKLEIDETGETFTFYKK